VLAVLAHVDSRLTSRRAKLFCRDAEIEPVALGAFEESIGSKLPKRHDEVVEQDIAQAFFRTYDFDAGPTSGRDANPELQVDRVFAALAQIVQ
jgi:hypothetical protein